jgi:nucleotide-binding universal stress UspA family protein
VRVLTVAESFPPVMMEPWYSSRESLEHIDQEVQKRARALTKKTADNLKKKRFKVETAVRRGDPRSEIVDEAGKWRADLIVMGSHGYTGIRRFVLGSVASSVVSHAPCSVEIVRSKKTKTR